MRETRRNVLKAGAGLATTGALAGLAGCSQVPVVGDIIGGGAFYSNDLYEPGTVAEQDHYQFTAVRPTEMVEYENEFSSETFDGMESFIDSMFSAHDIDFDEIETLTLLDGGSVSIITGEYAAEDVVNELEDGDFDSETETDNGYEILLNRNQRTCTAVSDEAIATLHSERALSSGANQGQGGMGPADREVQDLRSISYGETVQSQLDANDETGYRGYYEPVTFSGTEGDVVTISMPSSGDTYLMLQDPAGNIVHRNDDGGNGFNSQISNYRLQSSGEYTIIATSYSDGATFTYNLSLEVAFNPEDMISAVEGIVGVRSGDTSRYVDSVEEAGELVNAIGGGTLVSGRTFEEVDVDNPSGGQIDSSVASGYSVQVNGAESNVTAAVVFDRENDVDTGDVEDWVENHSSLSDADDLNESQQGRVGIINGVIETDDL